MPWSNGSLPALAFALALAGSALAAGKGSTFGKYPAPAAATVRKEARAWLTAAGATDRATVRYFDALWAEDRPLLDRVVRTLTLGDCEAAQLLASARDTDAPVPTEVPAVLRDVDKPAFYRHNLALAYARALTQRRAYEDALEVLVLVEPDRVVDPAAYFFHRAVCEYSLLLRDAAQKSIDRLLTDVPDVPHGHRSVAALMHLEMETWQDRDLAWIARMRDGIQRRLALGRGGKLTRRLQRQVLVQLAERIKQRQRPLPPDGLSREAPRPRVSSGTGDVNDKLKQTVEWIVKLPEKDRARALPELLRKLPAADRAVIERYFKELARRSGR
jgi:hypothetical protein